jgi:hypothetical protein
MSFEVGNRGAVRRTQIAECGKKPAGTWMSYRKEEHTGRRKK